MVVALLLLLLALLPSGDADRIVCCGQEEVFIVDVSRPDAPRKVWSWTAAEERRTLFRSTDECKPVEEGAKILVTASSGGVALVDVATRDAVYFARVQNAHSAELLPGNRLVVAGSYGEEGNRLVVFDRASPDRPLSVEPLHSAHGAVWDGGRLWALGETELRAYALEGNRLVMKKTFALPDRGGHDLRPVPGTDRLLVTTNGDVLWFDRRKEAFSSHPDLGGRAGVKGLDVHPRTGRLLYVQAEERWWAFGVKFLDPAGEVRLPDERLYKARWFSFESSALREAYPQKKR